MNYLVPKVSDLYKLLMMKNRRNVKQEKGRQINEQVRKVQDKQKI